MFVAFTPAFAISDRSTCATVGSHKECYVATTGNDQTGLGSAAVPWKTLVKCFNEVNGNTDDVCWFQNGTYLIPENATSDSGTTFNQGLDLGSYCGNDDGTFDAADQTHVAKAPYFCTRDQQGGGTGGHTKTFRAVNPGLAIMKRDYALTGSACQSNMMIRNNVDNITFQGFRLEGQWLAENGATGITFKENVFDCPNSNDGSNWSELLVGDNVSSNIVLTLQNNLFEMSGSCPVLACRPDASDSSCGKPSHMHLYGLTSPSLIENNDFRVEADYPFANGDPGVACGGTERPHSAMGFKNKVQGTTIDKNFVYVAPGARLSQCLWLSGTGSSGSTGANLAYQNICVGADQAVLQELACINDKVYNWSTYNVPLFWNGGPETPLFITGTDIFNNILDYSTSALAMDFGSSSGVATLTGQGYVNNQDYYLSAGTLTFGDGIATYTGLPAWKVHAGLKETASDSLLPPYTSPATLNFHLTNPSFMTGRGIPYSSVLGAYITGSEQIGCSSYAECHANGQSCGNGTREGTEQCDGTDLGGEDCESRGHDEGTLACDGSCHFVTTACCDCGDSNVGCTEQCDNNTASCHSIDSGYTGGTATCFTSTCTWNTSSCTIAGTCGDGNIDAGEQCDGVNLGGETCASQGFPGGTLACSACSFVYTGCTASAGLSSAVCAVKPKRSTDGIVSNSLLNSVQVNVYLKDIMPANDHTVDESVLTDWFEKLAAANKRAFLAVNLNYSDRAQDQDALPAWAKAICPEVHVLAWTDDRGTVDTSDDIVYHNSTYWPVWWNSGCETVRSKMVAALTSHFSGDPRVIGFFTTGYGGLFPISLAGEQTVQTCDPSGHGSAELGWKQYGYTLDCTQESGNVEQSLPTGTDPYGPAVLAGLTDWATHIGAGQIGVYTERQICTGCLTSALYAALSPLPKIAFVNNGFRPFSQLGAGITRWQALQALGHHAGWTSLSVSGFPTCDDAACGTPGHAACAHECSTTSQALCAKAGDICPGSISESMASCYGALNDSKTMFLFATKTWNGNADAAKTCNDASHPSAPSKGVQLGAGVTVGKP